MSNKIKLLFIILIIAGSSLQSQNNQKCGSDQMINQAFITDPQYEILVNEFSAFAKKYTKEQFNVNEKGPIFQIPIVFHVLHNYGNENVSDASLLGALEDMNDDGAKETLTLQTFLTHLI